MSREESRVNPAANPPRGRLTPGYYTEGSDMDRRTFLAASTSGVLLGGTVSAAAPAFPVPVRDAGELRRAVRDAHRSPAHRRLQTTLLAGPPRPHRPLAL